MFDLANPLILLAIPLPFLLWLLPRASLKVSAALKVPFYNELKRGIENKKNIFTRQNILLPFIIWSLVVFALSGPRVVGEPAPLEREGYNIMLLLDISASMSWADMNLHGQAVSRLDVVKLAATQFVKERVFDKIGLILFGTRAYLQTPLTYDHQNILMRINDASVGLAGNATSMGDALGLAIKRMQNTPLKGRVVILLTDGANTAGILSPLKASDIAKDNAIKVYTIGLGAQSNNYNLGGLLLSANSDLDEDTLKAMAEKTGGRYFRATEFKSLETIYETINKLEVTKEIQESLRPLYEYYPWPLGLALLLFLAWLIFINNKIIPSFSKRELINE